MTTKTGTAPTPSEWLAANPTAPAEQAVAVAFLNDMERRDLAAAERALTAGFVMVFPGPARYSRLDELVAGSRGRYKRVAKRIEAVEGFAVGSTHVVWVRGTLYGENSFGVPFADVRFVDRFEIVRGLLTRQDVWNDLAESGVLAVRS